MTTEDHNEAIALRGALVALMTGIGRGGLSTISAALQMTPSAMRKRLQKPDGGLDVPTLRCVSLLMSTKATPDDKRTITKTVRCGDYIIEHRDGQGVTWRRKPISKTHTEAK